MITGTSAAKIRAAGLRRVMEKSPMGGLRIYHRGEEEEKDRWGYWLLGQRVFVEPTPSTFRPNNQ